MNLREYQLHGADYIRGLSGTGALLADDVGLGKTAQALKATEGFKTLVVCPAFVKGVWASEATKWCREVNAQILGGCKPYPLDDDNGYIYIINYNILHEWKDALIGHTFDAVIFDEAHYLSSPDSKRSKAAKAIALSIPHRIALTATPMTSRPCGLWNIVDTISPGRFGNKWAYYKRYCDAKKIQVSDYISKWDINGISNADELRYRLSTFMLRRAKADVSLELPPRQRQIIRTDVAPKYSLDVAGADKSTYVYALQSAAIGKVKTIAEMAASHVAQGAKVVIFCHHRNVAEAIAHETGYDYIHGGITDRQLRIDAHPDGLVATMDAIGVGIDLSYANVGIFAELDYVPSKLIQAEGRIHRYGQHHNVIFQYMVANGTIDDIIANTVINKLEAIEATIGHGDDALRESLEGSEDDALKHLYEVIANADDEI